MLHMSDLSCDKELMVVVISPTDVEVSGAVRGEASMTMNLQTEEGRQQGERRRAKQKAEERGSGVKRSCNLG